MVLRDRARFLPMSSSVAEARHFVAIRLTIEGCSKQAVRDAELLVSELATNAIRHAGTSFTVVIVHRTRDVMIEVVDTGGGEPALREPGPDGGHGLQTVDAVADDWGVRRELDEKRVYFRLAC